MSARDELRLILSGEVDWEVEAAYALLDQYAHELAEKIRWAHHPDRDYLEAEDCADLIDPEVT